MFLLIFSANEQNGPPTDEAQPLSTNEPNGPPTDEAQPLSTNEQNGPPTDEARPLATNEQNGPPTDEAQPLPEDSSNSGRSRPREGLEGRVNVLPDKEFRERNNALRIDNGVDEEAAFSQLKPVTVELHKKENREAHKTDDYEIQELILRRGQVFDVTVTFNRDYNPGDDILVVQFVTGKRPQESKGSIVRVAVGESLSPKHWGMQVKETSGSTVHLSIMSSAKAIIGRYEVFIETKRKGASGEESLFRYKHEELICILFNAWCSDDAVYMENDEHRNEYVMEDSGYIWKGTSHWKEKIPWNFGQFEDVALNCALWLLDKSGLSSIALSSPIHVVRTISAMANSNDRDGGVLLGRWTNDFSGGTAPLAWAGSTSILEEFWKHKKTVRYGQCWVFSGLVTALSRALGIPTRSVTNFDSAHDKDESMTIDYHFDEEGDFIGHMSDSVWNYHVWNESWFKRSDLPAGHDGWQVYDATPQEKSDEIFRCGPASVKAVKNGEVYLPYDTGFVFAEVNGDTVYWDVKEDGSMKARSVDKHYVGNSISTRTPGSEKREDITGDYKYPDGSEEERDAVKFAFQYSSRIEHEIYKPEVEDVEFRLEVEDTVHAGNSFDAAVVVVNKSENTQNIRVNLAAVLSYYTGVPEKRLKGYKLKFLLNSNAEKRLVLTIEPQDYMTKNGAGGSIKLYVKGDVEETGQSFATQDVVELTKPTLNVTASATQVKIDEDVEVTFSFTNPLPVPLTKGQFHLEATRMKPKSLVVDCKGPVGVKEEAKMSATFTATRKGKHHIAVSFQSNELTDVHGECTVSEPEAT